MTEPVQHESHARLDHRQGRTAERIAVVGAVLLLVAIVKPWGQPAATPEPARPARPAATGAVATDAGPVAEPPCVSKHWLIEADERWGHDLVRTWVLTDAVEATGPLDPAIRFVPVAAHQVLSLGYCPSVDDEAGLHTKVTVYRLDPTLGIVAIVPYQMPREADAAANVLYRLAPRAAGSQSPDAVSWPTGRYVLRVDGPAGYRRWLGVDVMLILVPPSAPISPAPSG